MAISSLPPNNNPENTVLREDNDATLIGLYSSLAAGGLMLAYAIYYVTVVNVSDDYSYLTLGIITGLTGISVIGMHEWFRYQNGPGREENPIEEYGGAIGVLMGALSAVWLPRFAVFYAGKEKDWISVQDGDVWMPVWLATLQTISMILVMEISTRSIKRHSLGTLPRTIVILAPLSLALSAIGIWLDYSRGELEIFVTISVVLLTASAIFYSLRLDRAILYLLSSGMAVFLPIYIALGEGEIEYAGLLVPAVVIVGITATDRSLSKKMIENGSGFVVSAILFCQLYATESSADFVFADFIVSEFPFGLTFWLWFALLVGWFAPTTMQRTPAMPIGLALALALLVDEAALIGWAVGIAAFVYLETRPQARDWVVRLTFMAMIVSWWISAAIGSENQRLLASFGDFSLSSVEGSAYLLFPILVSLGFWAQARGRISVLDGPPMLLVLASLNIPLLEESSVSLSIFITAASLYQLHYILGREDFDDENTRFLFSALSVSPILASLFFQTEVQPTQLNILLPIVAAASIFAICNYHRAGERSLMLRFEMTAILSLILLFLSNNLANGHNMQLFLDPETSVSLTLLCLALVSLLLIFEGGGFSHTTPLEKLVGMAYLVSAAIISAVIFEFEGGRLSSLVLRDALVASVPLFVSFRTKKLFDLSGEARTIGSITLILLLLAGMTDVSGGLLALPVLVLVAQRSALHVSTPTLISLPFFAVAYASFFEGKGDTIWKLLDSLPYLGDSTELLFFASPRWTSLLLLIVPAFVSIYLPQEKSRKGGSRYGPEQLFGPAVAVLLAATFLLPDPKVAPIIVVAAISAGAWKEGVVHWFWISPLATVWAVFQLLDFINSGGYFGGDINYDYSYLAGGLMGILQYLLLENEILLQNVDEEKINPDALEYLSPVSRTYGYIFTLATGGISGILPFISALLAGWDGVKSGLPILLHGSVFVQCFTLYLWLLDLNIDSQNALLWPIFVGLIMINLSWKEINPYLQPVAPRFSYNEMEDVPFDIEKDFGIFGSAFLLIALLPYMDYLDIEEVFGLSIVIISIHHVILGFQRDQGWRRSLSLIGMPSGLIITGWAYDGLIMVVMLFLASLTLIGQAVLYASRGGLEIGSTMEGANPFVSEVGRPLENTGPVTESKNVEADHVPTTEEKRVGTPEKEVEKVEAAKRPTITPLFSSFETDFGIRLEPSLVKDLKGLIDSHVNVDLTKWSPVLAISSNGAIVLNWESLDQSEE